MFRGPSLGHEIGVEIGQVIGQGPGFVRLVREGLGVNHTGLDLGDVPLKRGGHALGFALVRASLQLALFPVLIDISEIPMLPALS